MNGAPEDIEADRREGNGQGDGAAGSRDAGPWGGGMTLVWGAAAAVIFLLVQGVVFIPFAVREAVADPNVDPNVLAKKLESNGDVLAIATLAACPFVVGFCLLIAFARRRGPSLSEYFALRRGSFRGLLFWALLTLALYLLTYTAYRVLEVEMPTFMFDAYESSSFLPLLWVALCVGAPLTEEFLFRGLLFEGWRNTFLGVPGTAVVTSILWGVIHVQYELHTVLVITGFGLLLAWARSKSSSLVVPIIMHAFWNSCATIYVHGVTRGWLPG